MVEEEYNCNMCPGSFTRKYALRRHKLNIHQVRPENPKVEKAFSCADCGSSFMLKSSIIRHQRVKHIANVNQEDSDVVKCPLCPSVFKSNKDHDTHLSKHHKFNLETCSLNFTSFQDFELWKHDMEEETYSLYSKSRGTKKTKNGLSSCYLCHRSGDIVSKVKEGKKKRTRKVESIKIGARCPSSIHTLLHFDGSMDVVFSKTHAGHELGIQYLPLSKKSRDQFAKRIKEGETLTEILDTIKSSSSTSEPVMRETLVKRQDLFNISRSYNVKPFKKPKLKCRLARLCQSLKSIRISNQKNTKNKKLRWRLLPKLNQAKKKHKKRLFAYKKRKTRKCRYKSGGNQKLARQDILHDHGSLIKETVFILRRGDSEHTYAGCTLSANLPETCRV